MVAASLLALAVVPATSGAQACASNPIVCENSKDGTPSDEWDIEGAGDPTIQGFATDASVNVGETVQFKIDTDANEYTIEIYRLGYYRGNGARRIDAFKPMTLDYGKAAARVEDVTKRLQTILGL